jgi:hypothetical protein
MVPAETFRYVEMAARRLRSDVALDNRRNLAGTADSVGVWRKCKEEAWGQLPLRVRYLAMHIASNW